MFQGTSLLVLDAKGRLSLPSKYRESLLVPSQGEVTLTRHPDGCVLICLDSDKSEIGLTALFCPHPAARHAWQCL